MVLKVYMHTYLLSRQAANSFSFEELTIENISFGFVKIDFKKCINAFCIAPWGHDDHKVLSNSLRPYFKIKY